MEGDEKVIRAIIAGGGGGGKEGDPRNKAIIILQTEIWIRAL